jgi:surface antigen
VRWRLATLGGLGVLFASHFSAAATAAHGSNCVAYARELTGLRLDGNAAMWWPRAEGRYERGQQPSIGAVLVFKPAPTMRVGHVAVVSRVLGPREVLVDQANWIHGRVTKAMSVIDSSPNNDWTRVKVLEVHSGTHGRDNPTFGFIYPRELPANFDEAIAVTADHTARPHAIVASRQVPHDKTRHTRVAAALPKPTVVATARVTAPGHRVAKHISHRPAKTVDDKQIAAVY